MTANTEYDLLQFEFENRDRPCATIDEACDEYAVNYGDAHPDVEWILTPYDSWVKNPKYCGPPGRHPEDDDDCYASQPQEGDDVTLAEADFDLGVRDDDTPF